MIRLGEKNSKDGQMWTADTYSLIPDIHGLRELDTTLKVKAAMQKVYIRRQGLPMCHSEFPEEFLFVRQWRRYVP